eukprot:contig_20935_g5131
MSVKKHLLGKLEDCEMAAEARDTLRALFEDDTTSQRADLEDAMNALELQPGEAMIKYVGRADTLRNELATAGVTIDEHSLSLNILRELSAGHAMIKTVLKSKKKELRIAMVTSNLLATEKELACADDADIPPAVLAYMSRLGMKKD